VNKNSVFKGAIRIAGLLLLIFMALPVVSQETEPATSFRPALPGYEYRFPRDFFSHDDFRIEWWYYTGHLEDGAGRSFGYQLTFFRIALDGKGKANDSSRWEIDHIYFAHMTLSDIENEKFYFFERINRAGLGQAGAESDQLKVWNENWSLMESGQAHHLKAQEGGVKFELKLIPLKPLVIHGRDGVSQKGETSGNASHYFTFTRMRTEGQVILKDKIYQVKGLSWMDHEFSSNQLSDAQIGWDWFSVQLDNDTELMIYQIRKKNGAIEKKSSGTWVDANGQGTHLAFGEYSIQSEGRWVSEQSGTSYPAKWILEVPKHGIRLQVTPEMANQELHNLRSISTSYWEGSVNVSGTVKGEPVTGKGYVELVGYTQPLKQELPE
jgi:predicted secreted hydrolase